MRRCFTIACIACYGPTLVPVMNGIRGIIVSSRTFKDSYGVFFLLPCKGYQGPDKVFEMPNISIK